MDESITEAVKGEMVMKKLFARLRAAEKKELTLEERLTQLLTGDRELERVAACLSAYLESDSGDSAFLYM